MTTPPTKGMLEWPANSWCSYPTLFIKNEFLLHNIINKKEKKNTNIVNKYIFI